jgi:hypothetical protein
MSVMAGLALLIRVRKCPLLSRVETQAAVGLFGKDAVQEQHLS